jgi:hypothetical protein
MEVPLGARNSITVLIYDQALPYGTSGEKIDSAKSVKKAAAIDAAR